MNNTLKIIYSKVFNVILKVTLLTSFIIKINNIKYACAKLRTYSLINEVITHNTKTLYER